jgi:hypothetical protein
MGSFTFCQYLFGVFAGPLAATLGSGAPNFKANCFSGEPINFDWMANAA